MASVVAGYNRAIWPAQIVAFGLALAVLWLAVQNRAASSDNLGAHLSGIVLSAAWAWTGAVFHWQHFAGINFLAPAYGWLFVGQALLLAWSGGLRGRIAPRLDGSVVGRAGVALIGYAIIGQPLLALVSGEGLVAAQVVGLAPDPTAVFTLGLMLLAGGRAPLHLAVVPVLWTLIAGATAWALGMTGGLILPILGLACLLLLGWKNRQHR